MKGTRANEKLFWNNRARNYPRPFDRETYARTGRILRLLRGMGAEFSGRRLLDIGTGTGVYALRLAGKAKKVLGVDSSPEMMKLYRAECRRSGIKNARGLLSVWSALPAAKVTGRFDVALASMTMAVKTAADIRKMEKAAPLRVYIGWAGLRRNALLERVYARHNAPYKPPEGAARVLKILKALGRTPRVKHIRENWTKRQSVAETLRDIEIGLKVNGAEMDREWTQKLLRRLARGGKVAQRTSVRKALIVWRD